jgi:hypothetical protein
MMVAMMIGKKEVKHRDSFGIIAWSIHKKVFGVAYIA